MDVFINGDIYHDYYLSSPMVYVKPFYGPTIPWAKSLIIYVMQQIKYAILTHCVMGFASKANYGIITISYIAILEILIILYGIWVWQYIWS